VSAAGTRDWRIDVGDGEGDHLGVQVTDHHGEPRFEIRAEDHGTPWRVSLSLTASAVDALVVRLRAAMAQAGLPAPPDAIVQLEAFNDSIREHFPNAR
jgi:hypothetical protein